MSRKKNIKFKLDPEWLYKDPVDFEYNKYTLLGYLKKCEKRFDEFKVYPDFVELSLHLANIQSLMKEKTLLLTNKRFESCDDEILMKEVFPKKPPKLTEEEQDEINKTISFSNPKLLDAFNFAKSVWSIAFENITLSIKKNKDYILNNAGVIIYRQKELDNIFIWEYDVIKPKELENAKITIKNIFKDKLSESYLLSVLLDNSRWKTEEELKQIPFFEVKANQEFPLEETFIPIMKRKLLAYLYQMVIQK